MLFNLLFVDTLYKPNINADAKPIYCFFIEICFKSDGLISGVFKKTIGTTLFDEKICKF